MTTEQFSANLTARDARDYVEEGAAFLAMVGSGSAVATKRPPAARAPATQSSKPQRVDVVVIGGGQAGLSVGYHLKRHNVSFVILEANERIGDTWRRRWDSLRLFTPARYDSLDGMPFPAPSRSFPTKDEMADYLEAYVIRFGLPVHTSTRVERVERKGDRYIVRAGDLSFDAAHVVVAMANYQSPRIPGFAGDLDADIVQLHSSAYRSPAQLRPGAVLIAGAGNSGAEIGLELARSGHRIIMSGRDTGHIPFSIHGFLGRNLLGPLVLRVLFHRIFTLSTPIGRKIRPSIIAHGGPLIRVKPKALAAAGVERVGRIAAVSGGRPVLDDGRSLDVANVVWCTGFHPDYSWIDLPVFDEAGMPVHQRGAVIGEPGLYFVGMHFLYALSSTMIHGVGRDARYIADTIGARLRSEARQAA